MGISWVPSIIMYILDVHDKYHRIIIAFILVSFCINFYFLYDTCLDYTKLICVYLSCIASTNIIQKREYS